jgi:hypothetical protein
VDLLAYALNPGEALGRPGTAIQVRRVTPQQLARVSLPLYSLIVLHGVAELPEPSVRDLIGFVRNGGGIWIIPDRDVSPLRFAEGLGPLLDGLTLGQLKVPDQPAGIDRSEGTSTHPLLLPLLREEWGSNRDLTFSHYFSLQSPGSAAVSLRTSTGDPLLALVKQQRGLVLVQLFPGGLESSTLPRTLAYVPLVQQTAALLSRRGEADSPDVMRVGETHRIRLPEYRNLKGEVQLNGPEERSLALTTGESEVRVEGLTRAGAYQVSHPARKGGRSRWLGVNATTLASDLTPLAEVDQAALFGTRQSARASFVELGNQFQNRHEVLGPMLVVLLLAFAVEALVGAWQSRRQARNKSRLRLAG